MIGTAILFGSSRCDKALAHFPPQSLQGEFAVSFVGKLEPEAGHPTGCPEGVSAVEGLDAETQAAQLVAQRAVKGIAKLKVNRGEFDRQARRLQAHNVVYKETEYREDLVARWCPDRHVPRVPPPILDNVVAIPPDGDVDMHDDCVVASGPGDATAAGQAEAADAEIEAARQSRYISAFSPDDIPGAQESSATLEVAALQQQLEDIQSATKRSIAAEVESAIEGGACLQDDAGRERVLELCRDVRNTAKKLSQPERAQKIQRELHKAALGQQSWQQPATEPSTLAELACPRGSAPLSLLDWKVWAQARPTLWCYGDAGNLDPKRTDAPLLIHEWITAMCIREDSPPHS